jgi:hypothetical protein
MSRALSKANWMLLIAHLESPLRNYDQDVYGDPVIAGSGGVSRVSVGRENHVIITADSTISLLSPVRPFDLIGKGAVPLKVLKRMPEGFLISIFQSLRPKLSFMPVRMVEHVVFLVAVGREDVRAV